MAAFQHRFNIEYKSMEIILKRIYAHAPPSGLTSLDSLRVSSLLILRRDTKSGAQIATAFSHHALERDCAEVRVGPLVRSDDLSAAGDADDQGRLNPRLDLDFG